MHQFDQGERRSRGVGSALGVAVLSATLASISTFTLLSSLGGVRPISIEPTIPPTTAEQPAVAAAGTDAATSDDIADIVARAKQSVVTITMQGMASDGFSPFSMPTSGVGSGIVISANGLILTNNHVVEGARQLTVTTADGREISASIVVTDPDRDMAVIRADAEDLTPAALGDSSVIEVGETVLAIGSPLGQFTETVTRGIVSALGREITVGDEFGGGQKTLSKLIQTDAAINPGNSGGALINDEGEVVGMNTAVSRSAEGIGFAIPINEALQLIDQAVRSIA
jgi:S1-C subfamily serine protease